MLLKSETLQLKGIAIFIMVFLHLFKQRENVDLCLTYIDLFGEPLISQLVKFTEICVPLYLFLSGYGLYILFQREGNIHPLKRIFKLYLHLWVVILCFIPLACIVAPSSYPKSVWIFLENFIAWKPSYNWEWWFIFPYVLLLSVANYLFRCVQRWNLICILLVSGFIYVSSYLCISVCKPLLKEFYILSHIMESLRMSSSFLWGAMFVKYDIIDKIKNTIHLERRWKNIILLLLLLLAIGLRALIPIHAISVFFMIFLVCWFALIDKSKIVESLLMKIGGHSTNIWLVHTFFCYYLFHDFIYSLRYPVVILVVVLVFSLISSMLLGKIYQSIERKLLYTKI